MGIELPFFPQGSTCALSHTRCRASLKQSESSTTLMPSIASLPDLCTIAQFILLIHVLYVALAVLAGCQQRSERWRVEMLVFQTGNQKSSSPVLRKSRISRNPRFPFHIRHEGLRDETIVSGIRAQVCNLQLRL